VVWVVGFEPTVSGVQGRRSGLTELHPGSPPRGSNPRIADSDSAVDPFDVGENLVRVAELKSAVSSLPDWRFRR
jgi:hypothetical protein